jgi:hypothetical protein
LDAFVVLNVVNDALAPVTAKLELFVKCEVCVGAEITPVELLYPPVPAVCDNALLALAVV